LEPLQSIATEPEKGLSCFRPRCVSLLASFVQQIDKGLSWFEEPEKGLSCFPVPFCLLATPMEQKGEGLSRFRPRCVGLLASFVQQINKGLSWFEEPEKGLSCFPVPFCLLATPMEQKGEGLSRFPVRDDKLATHGGYSRDLTAQGIES